MKLWGADHVKHSAYIFRGSPISDVAKIDKNEKQKHYYWGEDANIC